MELRFASATLESLDALQTEVLALFLFADERPLAGVAGLVDWRLCGRISALLVQGMIDGRTGEALLMPPPERRLAAERLLFLGAGARDALDEAGIAALFAGALARVLALGVRSVALALPHASLSWLRADRAIDLSLEAARAADARLDELLLVDTADAQRLMEPRIERARRRALDV